MRMKELVLRSVWAAMMLAAFSMVCFGQFGQSIPQVVEARTALATNGVHAGSRAKAVVVGEVKPGFHINAHHPTLNYLIPTKVEFEPSKSVHVERVLYPKGRPIKFSFSETALSVYEGEVPIGLQLRVSKSVSAHTISLHGKLDYQACNDHSCLPPTSVPVSLSLKVLPASTRLRQENSGLFSKIKFN